ncbi:flavoprotein-domain-containing protein [Mycena olivaceomarginata]|nr:flavoprotein-domain-containing protein [Mycena olivaceomarginata]
MSKPFVAETERRPGHTHVLLITTGSVASVKAPLIVEELLRYESVKVEVVATKPSLVFFDADAIRRTGVRVWTDADEWPAAYKIGDPILHIELRRWADIVLVAPCSANTLSKIAHGVCDNLATSLMRALAPTTPTYIFPRYEYADLLACGDIGIGAMSEWRDVVQVVVDGFKLRLHVSISIQEGG